MESGDYCGLNEVSPPLSAAMAKDTLELQHELESKAARWYAIIDIVNMFFSIPLVAECRPLFAFTSGGRASNTLGISMLAHFHEFESSLVQEFELFQEFREIHDFGIPRSLLGDWLWIIH